MWSEIQATGDLRLWMGIRVDDWIDFANNRPADRLVLEPGLRWNLGRRLLMEVLHTYSSLDVEGGRLFRFHAPELRTVLQFNTRVFVRGIVQYVDVRRDPSLSAELAARGRRRLETMEISWEEAARRYVAVLQEIAGAA